MLISIIIPVYNKEEYLDECIKSVVTQDYNNLEIIIINDGSHDNSEKIINAWIKKDDRIKYIYQQNRGVAHARNRGLSIAKGEYIFFLDADDMLEKNAITKLVNHAKKNSADIIIGNIIIKQDNDKIKNKAFKNIIFNEENLHSIEVILEMFVINQRHMAMAGNKLYKLSFINKNKVRFMDKVIAEDRLFNLICYVQNPVIQLVNEYTYIYNKIKNSRSSSYDLKFFNESLSLINYFKGHLKENTIFENKNELFQLTVMYDVYKIVNHTYHNADNKIKMTISTINKLRYNSLIKNTLYKAFNNKQIINISKKNLNFFQVYLLNYLLLKSPYLIIVYKVLGVSTRKIRYSIKRIIYRFIQ